MASLRNAVSAIWSGGLTTPPTTADRLQLLANHELEHKLHTVGIYQFRQLDEMDQNTIDIIDGLLDAGGNLSSPRARQRVAELLEISS
jgi:hypothetical protein